MESKKYEILCMFPGIYLFKIVDWCSDPFLNPIFEKYLLNP